MIPNAARRAPHQGNQQQAFHHAPNAALLIDFDNVTMGIRSDLGKELKSLLNSEVIRGKVAVQRAYADWRRYPQYIVPLAESSIDLIFAPAYGSAKKNATDLRMAIDAIELVFTRPEIGTYILMTGDSDFSSCVLKLKEYGKYVIGVGMRESSSDLLIQNCDEYYSYHALSGLTRTDEVTESKEDPWVLLKRAAQQMVADRDVMRTDRLKQVMLDLDPAFDEKKIGYSKFSRFVQEGASKGIIRLRKMENGQHEIGIDGAPAVAAGDGAARPAPRESSNGRGRGRGRGRDRERDESRREAPTPPAPIAPAPEAATPQAAVDSAPAEQVKEEAVSAPDPQASAPAPQQRTGRAPASRPAATTASATAPAANDLEGAYGLLQQALRELGGTGGKTIRDGDVKRKMLDLSPDFDESRLGFPKFTRFLRQAHNAEAIDLKRAGAGNYEVAVGSASRKYAAPAGSGARRGSGTAAPVAAPAASAVVAASPTPQAAPAAPAGTASSGSDTASAQAIVAAKSGPGAGEVTPPAGGMGMRGRRGGRGAAPSGPPPMLPGQVVQVAKSVAPEPTPEVVEAASVEAAGEEKPAKPRARRGRRGRASRKDEVEQVQEAPMPEQEKAAVEPAAEVAAASPSLKAEEKVAAPARRRRGRGRGAATADEAPEILPGQVASMPSTPAKKKAAAKKTAPAKVAKETAPIEEPVKKGSRTRSRASKPAEPAASEVVPPSFSAGALGLPTEVPAIMDYLSTSYKGVGKKTVESLNEAFGVDLFRVLEEEPQRVRELLGDRRAGTLLDQWSQDVGGRRPAEAAAPAAEPEAEGETQKPKSRSRRGGRGRATRKKSGESGN